MKTLICFLLVVHAFYAMGSEQNEKMREKYCKGLSRLSCSDIHDCFPKPMPTNEAFQCVLDKIGNECYLSVFQCLRSCMQNEKIGSSSVSSCMCLCLNLV